MKSIIGVLIVSILVLACGNEDQKARLEVRLTDSPGDYEQVNIDIRKIEVHTNTSNWVTYDVNAGVYNLLELANGLDTLLASFELPPGKLSQIRLF